jgi:hypothetical protein
LVSAFDILTQEALCIEVPVEHENVFVVFEDVLDEVFVVELVKSEFDTQQ